MDAWVEIRDRLQVAFVAHTINTVSEICPGCLEKLKNSMTEAAVGVT
ncbi:MAG: hypothetical protein AAB722_00205 [Patescibacteria group bacterium]